MSGNASLDSPDDMHDPDVSTSGNLSDSSDSSDSQVEEIVDDEIPSYFDEKDGKLFHRCSNSPYPLPVDANEIHRLDLIHDIHYRLLGGAHYLGPVPEVLAPTEDHRRKVLDMGNGNGKWVMAMAEAFPEVKFRGVDIVPIATMYPLPNVRFEMHDIGEQLRWSDGYFDLIHARDISMAVRSWPNLINECARLLRPGGLFISCEWIHHPTTNIGLDVTTYAPASVELFDRIDGILQGKGVELVGPNIHLHLTQSTQFTDIIAEQRSAPIGQWTENEEERHIGSIQKLIFQRFIGSVMPMLTNSGMSVLEAGQLNADYLAELDGKDGLSCVYVITHARRV